jgi:hypothetical protein
MKHIAAMVRRIRTTPYDVGVVELSASTPEKYLQKPAHPTHLPFGRPDP